MNDVTLPKARKPFRARRPRRPADQNVPGQPAGDAPAKEGERSEAAEPAAASLVGSPAAADSAAAEGGPDGQPRGPRPPRGQGPRRQGRQQAQGGHQGQQGGQRGGRPPRPPRQPGADGGEPRGPTDPDAQPRFNDNPPRQFDPNRGPGGRQGKSRFDRGQGGAGGQGGQGRGAQGGQPPWGGRQNSTPYGGGSNSGGPERGNEIRRSRGLGPQHEEPVRLAKLLCDRGLCTQREADSYIERGWVIVNGERASGLGTRVHPAAEIRLAPEARGEQSRRVTILLNKPVDYASGEAEPGFEPALTLIGAETLDVRYDGPSFHASHLQGLAPAGSLDVDSMGLLVLTQDERVLGQLGGEDAAIEMEYLVGVDRDLGDESLAALNSGIEIDGQILGPAQVSRQGENQLKFVLTEGRESRLRRLCEGLGLSVNSVKRMRIGQVRLGDVPQGQWRYLRDDENF